MENKNTYQAVRIGDIADWRLICEISGRGMSAYLKNVNPTADLVTLFEETWPEGCDNLLERIENVVYDHPQVLDDFSADIVIEAPKAIWVPAEIAEDDDEKAAELYNQVYDAEEDDIMTEKVDDALCVYSLVRGLNGFLKRTFPGARIHSHLAVMTSRFRERSSDMPRLYVEIREGEADIIAFDRRELLTAATHQWHDPNDIQYHIYNIMSVYGLKPQEAQVSLSGLRDVKTTLMPELRKHVSYVMLTMLPSVISAGNISTNVSLLLGMRK